VRGEDHLVARPDSGSAERHDQTVRGIPDADRVLHTHVFGKMRFELGEIALLDERTAPDDVRQHGEVGAFLRSERTAVVEEGNRASPALQHSEREMRSKRN